MSARDAAIRAFAIGRRDARERGGFDEDEVIGAGLDAVPNDVLVQLLVERDLMVWEGETGALPGLPDNTRVSLITFEARPGTHVVVFSEVAL